jgi:hypothetical protein
MVRFNAINPPGAERACAEHLAGLLGAAGFAIELVPFGEGRAVIAATVRWAAAASMSNTATFAPSAAKRRQVAPPIPPPPPVTTTIFALSPRMFRSLI